MVAQDLTKLTTRLVLFGVILAFAIFRPHIFSFLNQPTPTVMPAPTALPVATLTPSPTPMGRNLGKSRCMSVSLQDVSLQPAEQLALCQEELRQLQAALDQRQDDLVASETALNQRQAELDGRETALNQGQDELVAREAALGQRQVELDAREAALDQRQTELDTRKAELDQQEAGVTGMWRWSLAMLILSGLLGVPSALLLVAMWRQNKAASGKGTRSAQSPAPNRARQGLHAVPVTHNVTVKPGGNGNGNGRGYHL